MGQRHERRNIGAAYRMPLFASTARPFTPNRWPPADDLAFSRTAKREAIAVSTDHDRQKKTNIRSTKWLVYIGVSAQCLGNRTEELACGAKLSSRPTTQG